MAGMGFFLQLLRVLRIRLLVLQAAEISGSGPLVISALSDFLKEILTTILLPAFPELWKPRIPCAKAIPIEIPEVLTVLLTSP